MKNIYLFVGRSGSGKTTLTETLAKKIPEAVILQSYTTRPRRSENEKGHIFATVKDFDEAVATGNIAAWTDYNNNYYWATNDLVDASDFYIIDVKGVDYFLENYKGKKTPKIIYIDINYDTSENRVTERFFKDNGLTMATLDFTNTKIRDLYNKEVAHRLAQDTAPFYQFGKSGRYDLRIVNDEGADFNTVVNAVYEFILKEEAANG